MGQRTYKKYRSQWAERFLVTRGTPGSHASCREIAEEYSCSRNTVTKHLRAIGIETQAHLDNHSDLIGYLYRRKELSLATLGKLFGCSPPGIRKVLIRNEIPLRRSGRPKSLTNRHNYDGLSDFLEENSELVSLTGCRIWVGCRTTQEYGQFTWGGQTRLAHRESWKVHVGEIPAGKILCHKCDTPPCINPDHLYAGSYSENALDQTLRSLSSSTAKISTDEVLAIRRRMFEDDPSYAKLAREYSLTPTAIRYIITGENWGYLPLWPPHSKEVPTEEEIEQALQESGWSESEALPEKL